MTVDEELDEQNKNIILANDKNTNEELDFFKEHFAGDLIGIGRFLFSTTNGNMWDAYSISLFINILVFIPMAWWVEEKYPLYEGILHFWHPDRIAFELFGVFIALPSIAAIYIWQADGILKALSNLNLQEDNLHQGSEEAYHKWQLSKIRSRLLALWSFTSWIVLGLFSILCKPFIYVSTKISKLSKRGELGRKKLDEQHSKWSEMRQNIYPSTWQKPANSLHNSLLKDYIKRQHINFYNDLTLFVLFWFMVGIYVVVFLLIPEETVIKHYYSYWWEKVSYYPIIWTFFTFLGVAMIARICWHHYCFYQVIINNLDNKKIKILYHTTDNGFRSVSNYFGRVSWLVVIVGIFIALQAGFPSIKELSGIFTNQDQSILNNASPFIIPTTLYIIIIIIFIILPIQKIRRHMRDTHRDIGSEALMSLEEKRKVRLDIMMEMDQANILTNDKYSEAKIKKVESDIQALIIEKERIDADDITWPFSISRISSLASMFSFPILLPTILEIIGIAVDIVN